MGQKQSKSGVFNRYLSPLPEYYQRNEQTQLYSIRNQNHTCIQSTNPQIPHPQTIASKDKQDQQQILESKTVHSDKTSYVEGLPSHLRHFVIILNDFQTKDYLNHLVYRNQPEFKEFIVQVPFGQVEKNEKYTKIHLYVQEVALTLNHVFNLPFHDMCMILYTSLIAYKYLYSYFGLFKIQENMIGFTRDGKTKVWLNHKLTKDKPLPIVADINLKRYKQEQNYMVDDLMTIFWNKVDRETVPKNFTLVNKFSSIRSSRHTPSRLTLSRIENEAQLSKSMVKCLENNLIDDFSQGSFDKCLQYLEGFLNMQRPEFLKIQSRQNPQIQEVQSQLQKQSPMMMNSRSQPYRNFVPSIQYLIRKRKEFTRESADLRSSTVNLSVNYRQVGECSNRHQIKKTNSSNYESSINQGTFITDNRSINMPYESNNMNQGSFGLIEQSVCRPLNLQNSRPTSFGLPVESTLKIGQQSVYRPLNLQNQSQSYINQPLIQSPVGTKEQSIYQPVHLQNSGQSSPNKSQKISMRVMMQPVLKPQVTPNDSVNNTQYVSNQQSYVQNNLPSTSMSFQQKYPVSSELKNTTFSLLNGTQYNKNKVNSQVMPYQFTGVEESQKVNQSSDFNGQKYQFQNSQQQYIMNQPTTINRVVKL